MMRTSIPFIFLLLITTGLQAQNYTLQSLKALKNIAQPDYIQLKDEEISYPVTGLTEIHMEQITAGGQGGAGGGLFAVIEYWVVDAKGKIVYNTVFTINPLNASGSFVNTDTDYMRYMKKNNKFLLKKRREKKSLNE
ncbi:MAG: hypothetical protein JWO58_187 [Chitinophagaceae bacterium]|nr:hypothetical protein [Chitinophagaceae bacterium]